MKHLATTLLVLGALAVAGASLAGPPLPGEYKTTDLGGVVSLGRYTEGWLPGGGALAGGVTLNAQSFDGFSLGTQWYYRCATTTVPATLLTNTVNASGNGNRTYMKQFVGGTIWLSGTGPWANGDAGYPGVIDSYTEFETIQYSNWNEVASVTNVQATAHFADYPGDCMTFYVSNGTLVGTTAAGQVKPATYPDFLYPGDCNLAATDGAWWDFLTMTLSITSGCATPSRPSTWGAVKQMYR